MNEVALRQSPDDRSSCTYRDLALDDVNELGSVHMLAFDRSVLASFGIEVMRKYYRWLLSSPGSVSSVGAFINGELVGLAILSNSYRLRSFLKQEWALLSIRVAMAPRLTVVNMRSDVRVIPLNRPAPTRRILVARLRERPPSPAGAAFVDCLKAVATTL